MKNKDVKKMHKIRNAVMMVLLSVLMLSTGTFAWFTMSSNAKVNGIQMTVANKGGALQIKKASTDAYGSVIDYSGAIEGQFMPATLPKTPDYDGSGNLKIYKPKYVSDGSFLDLSTVDDVEALTSAEISDGTTPADGQEKFCYQTIFYVRTDKKGSEELPLSLLTQGFTDEGYTSGGNEFLASRVLRVAFTLLADPANGITTPVTKVFAPDTDNIINQNGPAGVLATVTGSVLTAENYGYYDVNKYNPAAELFNIPVNKDVKIQMTVWFEGQDKDCVNQIMDTNITGGFTFSVPQ